MRLEDVPAAVVLHRRDLGNELVARLGPRALQQYHRAWIDSPTGIALAATDEATGEVVGFLLGATDPPTHYRAVVAGHGSRLALATARHAAVHPALAWELLRTRAVRWVRGLVRVLRRNAAAGAVPATEGDSPGPDGQQTDPGSVAAGTAEVTHVVVAESQRGRGVGRRLLEAALDRAEAAGARRVELVTPRDDTAAAAFYDACGWRRDGDVTSRSGERFLRFVVDLPADDARGVSGPPHPPSSPSASGPS